MLSKEMKAAIAYNRQMKADLKNVKVTPDLIVKQRQAMNDKLGRIPTLPAVKTSEVTVSKIPAEYHQVSENLEPIHERKIVLFIHGGGFATGSPSSRRYLVTRMLANAQLTGYAIAYSQYPEAKHPTALIECVTFYRGLLKKGYRPENIYLYGESAGAMLCLSMCHYLNYHHIALPGKICIYSPVVDLDGQYASRKARLDRDPVLSGNIKQQLSGYFSTEWEAKDPYISCIFGDFHGFPPVRINVGTEELLFDDSLALASKCQEAGVKVELKIWEGLFHVFPMFPSPESEQALREDAAFFTK